MLGLPGPICIFHMILIAAGYAGFGWAWPVVHSTFFGDWEHGQLYAAALVTFILAFFIVPALLGLLHHLLKNEPPQVLCTLIALAETAAFLALCWRASGGGNPDTFPLR
jgi:hypothetical protein